MSDRKNILLIATGGTIASKKSDNGLKPQISPEELMQYIPQVKDICDFHAVQLINLDSSYRLLHPIPASLLKKYPFRNCLFQKYDAWKVL